VSGKDLLLRIVGVLGLALVFLVLLGTAHAVPIKPDIKQLVAQPQPHAGDYAPARAGWDGPESARPMAPSALVAKETIANEASAVRRAVAGVLLPDPRIFAAIVIAIIALRQAEQKRRRGAEVIVIDSRRREPMAA
jgi:hypothetical protein